MTNTQQMAQTPVFASRRILSNFILITLCSQFTFALLAMKGVLLPQILELWDVSKTQFGLLLSIYGLASNFMYVLLSWAQDRYAPRQLRAKSSTTSVRVSLSCLAQTATKTAMA